MNAPGLILFAHGARDPRWAAPFEAVVRHIGERRPQLQVRLAFLEFMAPDLHAAAHELCTAGCPSVDVLPMFLGTGGHLRKDLPPLLERLRAEFPHVRWTLHAAIGEHDTVAVAMAMAALALLPDGRATVGATR
jgi:sirohydrochlorin cobaltochelatase